MSNNLDANLSADLASWSARRLACWAAVAALAAAVPPGTAIAQAQDRFDEVAGWELKEFRQTMSGEPIHALEMERKHGATRITYAVKAGAEREIRVLRLNCGTATSDTGGQVFGGTVYIADPSLEGPSAAQDAIRQASADYDEFCQPAPGELDAAMFGFDTAFAAIEGWARERPLPAAHAWTIGGGWSERGNYITRLEPPVEVRYFVPEEGDGPGIVSIEDQQCAGDDPSGMGGLGPVEAEVSRAGSPSEHRARAGQALAATLAEISGKCGWAPGRAARLATGFEEAQARAESEWAGMIMAE